MINRYQGNSGKMTRYPETRDERRDDALTQTAMQEKSDTRGGKGGGMLAGLEGLGKLLPEKLGSLENEDIILMLILYLMYKESGDSELLIILGAMFLL